MPHGRCRRKKKLEPAPRPTMDADVYAREAEQAAQLPVLPKPTSGNLDERTCPQKKTLGGFHRCLPGMR